MAHREHYELKECYQCRSKNTEGEMVPTTMSMLFMHEQKMGSLLLISEMDLTSDLFINNICTLLQRTNVTEITLEAIGSETMLDNERTPYGDISNDFLEVFQNKGITKLTIRASVLKRSTISTILDVVPSITDLVISEVKWAKDGDNNSLRLSSDTLQELILHDIDLSEHSEGDQIRFERVPNLQSLTMEKCRLSQLPNSLRALKSLQKLNASYNYLTQLPTWMGLNEHEDVPSIENPAALCMQDVGHNQIESMPENMKYLTHLRELLLDNNWLKVLPGWIRCLKELTRLDLASNNQLRELNKSLIILENLKTLTTKDCFALVKPPLAVCEGGLNEVKKYYSDIDKSGSVERCHCTVAVIGNKMAGKSSLVHTIRQMKDSRTNRSKEAANDETTKVFNFVRANIQNNQETFRANFIDFGGDKVYHHAYKLTFRHRCILVFVVSIEEFDKERRDWGPNEAARQVLARWVAQMSLVIPGFRSPVLVLTHKDKFSEDEFQNLKAELLKEYYTIMEDTPQSDEGKADGMEKSYKFAHVLDVSYNDFDDGGVDKHFRSFIDHLHQHLEFYIETWPLLWLDTFSSIKKQDKHTVKFSEVSKDSNFKAEDVEVALEVHRRSGDILWYRDNSALGDIVFHDIGMVTKVISLFFHHKDSAERLPIGECGIHTSSWSGKQSKGILPEGLALKMVESTLSDGVDEVDNYDLTQKAKLFTELLKTFKLIHGPAPHNGFHCYVVPYFMDAVGPPTHSGEVSLGVDVNVLELGVPDYAYQQLTMAFLCKDWDKYQVFAYGNGASAKAVNSDIHLYHDADSQQIHLRVESDAKHLDQAVESLGALVKLVKEEFGQDLQYDVLCVHCLTLNRLNPATQRDTKFLDTYAGQSQGKTPYGSATNNNSSISRLCKCPVVELTKTDGLRKAVERLGVVDDMTDIMKDMPPDEPQIRNYPTLQTEMYRPVMREKIYIMTQTRGRALIINNEVNRDGSQHDYRRIELMLKNFGFVISELSESKGWPMEDIFRAIRMETVHLDRDTGESVHKGLGMFVLILMTHGRYGCISGSDETAMALLDVYKLLSAKNFPAMAGKPKLLIFQLCSGEEQEELTVEEGQEELIGRTTSKHRKHKSASEGAAKMDSRKPTPSPIEISSPSHVDFDTDINGHLTVDDLLLLRSSFDHFVSKRYKSGSTFIGALIPVFNKYAHREDVRTLGDRIQRCATEKSKERMPAAAAAQLSESPEGDDTKSGEPKKKTPVEDLPAGQQGQKRQKLVVDWKKMIEERTQKRTTVHPE